MSLLSRFVNVFRSDRLSREIDGLLEGRNRGKRAVRL